VHVFIHISKTDISGKEFDDALNFLAAVSKGHPYAFMSDENEEELDPNNTTVELEGDLAKKKALGVPPTACISEEVPSEEVPSEEVPSEEVPSEEVPSEEVPITQRRGTKRKTVNTENHFHADDEIKPVRHVSFAQPQKLRFTNNSIVLRFINAAHYTGSVCVGFFLYLRRTSKNIGSYS